MFLYGFYEFFIRFDSLEIMFLGTLNLDFDVIDIVYKLNLIDYFTRYFPMKRKKEEFLLRVLRL